MNTESIISLNFVPYKEEYFALIHKWNSDERIYKTIGYQNVPTEEETKQFLDIYLSNQNCIFSVIITDVPIGYFILSNINNGYNTAELHTTVGDSSLLNKPICVKVIDEILDLCFNKLDFHRITTIVMSNNPKLIKTARKYGWKEEGIMKEMVKLGNERLDYYLFRMLKSEFRRRG